MLKARTAGPLADRMIMPSGTDTLHVRSQDANPRLTRLSLRVGDGAGQAILELVGSELVSRRAALKAAGGRPFLGGRFHLRPCGSF